MKRRPAPAVSKEDAYRPALDGVRAVAVAAVIGYHLGWPRGGFLGVDVFFVLSGYLITTLLLREFAATRRISITSFWARRARRLLPAVLLLVSVCLLEVTKVQSEMATVAARRADILSTLFYYANWHFIATDQSYFAAFAEVSPLRHMWSLAIEEQFYLAWPLLMVAGLLLIRRRVVLLALLVVATAASASALAYQYAFSNPSRAYFGTDTRAHVLLVGAILALLIHSRRELLTGAAPQAVARFAGPIAAGSIFAGYALMKDQAGFYYDGGSLLFACAVAVAIWAVEARPASPVGRALATRPATWVGRISYSLYLWHWPIIIWVATFVNVDPSAQKALAVAATVSMAAFSFYVVEQPVRRGRVPWLRRSKLRLAIVVPVAFALFAGVAVQLTQERGTELSARPCPPGSPTLGSLRYCVQVNPTVADPAVVVTAGDSTSRALTPGLRDLAAAHAWRFVQAGQDGCSFLPLDIIRGKGFTEEQSACARDVPRILSTVERRYRPTVWIVSDVFALAPLRDGSGSIVAAGDPRRGPIVADALRRTLRKLTAGGAKVVLLADPPEGAPEHCGSRITGSTCGSDEFSTKDAGTRQLERIYRLVSAQMPADVVVVSVTDILCPRNGHCPAVVDGVLARYDGVHYTTAFSRIVARTIVARAEQDGVTF